MEFRELDTVVLDRDMPDLGLRRGDLGAVVYVHDEGAIEVEFVTADGRTEALATLSVSDVRAIAATDLVAVRPLRRSA
jgi:hypothetical protein